MGELKPQIVKDQLGCPHTVPGPSICTPKYWLILTHIYSQTRRTKLGKRKSGLKSRARISGFNPLSYSFLAWRMWTSYSPDPRVLPIAEPVPFWPWGLPGGHGGAKAGAQGCARHTPPGQGAVSKCGTFSGSSLEDMRVGVCGLLTSNQGALKGN